MNKKKVKELKEIQELDRIYNDTYKEVSCYVIAKIDRIDYIEKILIDIYKEVFKNIQTNGVNFLMNERRFCMDIAKKILFEYYNNSTPNNAKFNITPDLLVENIDFNTYNFSLIESYSEDYIEKTIEKLDILTQKLLILFCVQKLTIKEIGILLSYTENEISFLLSKSFHLLEKYLQENNGGKSNGKVK